MAAGRAGRGVEARVAGGEAAAGADLRERRRVELDVVPARVEVGEEIGVAPAELVERDAVLSGAAAHLVVARASFDPVDTAVAADGVVPGASDHRVGTISGLDVVVAAEPVDDIGVCSADDGVIAFGAVNGCHSNHPDID